MAGADSLPTVIGQLKEESLPAPHYDTKARSLSENDVGTLETAVHCLKNVDPLYYNSLMDKNNKSYLRKPPVKKYLHDGGFIAEDGTVYPTRQEQVEVNRANRKKKMRQEIRQQLAKKCHARLLGLRQQARADEVVYTRSGVYASPDCEEYREKVMLSRKHRHPQSRLKKKRLPSNLEMANVSIQTSTLKCSPVCTQTSLHTVHSPDCHISTQTSLKKSTCHICTRQTSKDDRKFASVDTQTGRQQTVNTANQTSFVIERSSPTLRSSSVSSNSQNNTKSSTEALTQHSSQVSECRSDSAAFSSPVASETFDTETIEKLKSEKDALEKELQKAKEFHKASKQALHAIRCELKLQQLNEEKKREKLMLSLAEKIHRKTALTVIRTTMEEQYKTIMSDMERVARQEVEDQKLKELLEYSLQEQLKKPREPTELAYVLPGQSNESMPAKLSSFHCQEILESLAQRHKMLGGSPLRPRNNLDALSCSSLMERSEPSTCTPTTASNSSASLESSATESSVVFRRALSSDLAKCAAAMKIALEHLSPRFSSGVDESSDMIHVLNEKLLELFGSTSPMDYSCNTSAMSSSRCSSVKLPPVDTSMPVNLTTASVNQGEFETDYDTAPVKRTAEMSNESSCSCGKGGVATLGMLSEQWSDMDQACSDLTSVLTLGKLSDDWSSDESGEIECPLKMANKGTTSADCLSALHSTSDHCTINRPSTPPVYCTPLTKIVSKCASSNSSLKTIKEGVPTDFSQEFSTPIVLSALNVLDLSSGSDDNIKNEKST